MHIGGEKKACLCYKDHCNVVLSLPFSLPVIQLSTEIIFHWLTLQEQMPTYSTESAKCNINFIEPGTDLESLKVQRRALTSKLSHYRWEYLPKDPPSRKGRGSTLKKILLR